MGEVEKLFVGRCEWLKKHDRDMVVIVCGNEGGGIKGAYGTLP
jgi:hypothetical protein